MPKLYSYRQVIRVLERLGFAVRHQRGSHIKLINSSGRVVIVPKRREIPLGTFDSILLQAGIDEERFQSLLK
ncbi:MAG: type II toxin-antitoxin system HicA family toxin [Dehalococcoidia bacterium]|nr:type II toxin-antitoxin system HicA family toxin [Dehalococcoidia bacterium]